MRKVYTNGTIYTVDENNPWAETVIIEDGRFTYVGNNDYQAEEGDEVIDLHGKFALPGLIDSHQHWFVPSLVDGPHANVSPIIRESDINVALEKIAEHVKAHPEYHSYKANVGNKENWPRTINIHDLDAICPDKPLFVHDAGAHSFVGNSRLMEAIGVTKDTPDLAPNHSYYGHDENGELTGFGSEWTQVAGLAVVNTVTNEDMRDNLHSLVDFNSSLGITGVYESGSVARQKDCYEALHDMDMKGELKGRVSISNTIVIRSQIKDAVAVQKEMKEKYESENITVDTIKIFIDGTTAEYSGYISKNYVNKKKRGGSVPTPKMLYQLFKEANEAGFNVHMHTIGNAAAHMIVKALQKLESETELKVKFIIAHLQLVNEEDIKELGRHNICLNGTPHWVGSLREPCIDIFTLPEEWRLSNYRYQTLWNTGANMTFSCDVTIMPNVIGAHVWSPFHGWEIGITRLKVGDMDESHIDDPKECLTLEQLIKGYTINGAIQMGWEKETGSIEVGKSADMVVLDMNPFEIDTRRLHELQVEEALFRGNTVYSKE
ncbi:MAG: amidohydrolase [Erysipelotrichaceae bacterium]|nr:amidohydrolase [Erysipelotrichaceae bacterium]